MSIHPSLTPLDSNLRQDRSSTGTGLLPQVPPSTSSLRRETLPSIYDNREWAGEADNNGASSSSWTGVKKRLSLPVGIPDTGAQASLLGDKVMEDEDDIDELEEGDEAVEPSGEASGSGSKAGKGSKKKSINSGLTTCRRGKRRCEPSPLVPASHPDAAKLPCARCRRFALECTRVEVKRRKGPPAVDLSAISDAVYGFTPALGEGSGSGTGIGSGAGSGAGPADGMGQLMEMEASPMPMPMSTPMPMDMGSNQMQSYQTPMAGMGMSYGQGQGAGQGYGSGWIDDRRRSSGLSGISGMSHDQLGYASSVRGGGSSHHSGDPSPSYLPQLDRSPSTTTASMLIPDNLDQVVSAPVVSSIIDLFFDYIYPLTPCLHRPTFLASLAARQDKTDPVFFALTLTVLASTLVQVPRSLVNFDKTEVEDLARRCVRVARAKIAFIYEESVPVEINFVVMAYFQGIVHLLLGNNTAHIMCTANAYHLALAMRLNEESSYEGLDPIESEIRRRTYWLLFQADKSTACMRARTINLRLEDAASLKLPAEVDDEQITSTGITMQTNGRTPIIAGFNVVTNLFRIMNDALLLQRRKAPPTVDSILADLQNVNELREKVLFTTKNVSSKLQLKTSMDSRVSSPAHDWEAKLEARFLDFFHSAGDETHTLNSYLVLQGNILVTQSVVRLVLLHSKEALLVQLAAITHLPVQGMGNLAGMQATEPAEEIACELLDGLNSLPVECVATNGPSLVQKVRFVAIQLMECSVAPSPTTSRAQKLLMQFLSVLSVIEGMYTFGKDISAE